MSDSPLQPDEERVPLEVTRQIDKLCDEFESTLVGGKIPALAPFIDRIESVGKRRLLVELVAIAEEHLRSCGVIDIAAAILLNNQSFEEEIQGLLRVESIDGETKSYGRSADGGILPDLTPRRRKSRGLRIKCPHCSNHVELIGDTSLDSVVCAVCGSTFSLVDRSKDTRLAETLQQIGRFELVSRLGVGGFGTVWKARDTELDRVVAIKIPRHSQLSKDEMEQFRREARMAAQLRHPNIVPVHEVGREGDFVFIVSDLIRGVSLADLLTGKRLALRESARLCVTVADALDHAHRKGVVHRDLKPANIMIDDDDQPNLMDFGLAKREAEEVTMTVDGQVIGTPAYMSPEQAGGRGAWVDRRSDIYSLGVILFELLTGELPFRGNAQIQAYQRIQDDAPSIRSLNKNFPVDLATICAKCLEREPGNRYQTANDVAAELTRFLDGLPIQARPLSPPQRLMRWAARRPTQAVVAGLILFLAIAGPSTSLVIERQRARLSALVDEKNNLIDLRDKENRAALAKSAELQSRLDVWEGRANPWTIWPPDQKDPPKRRQLASLLAARRDLLADPSSDQPNSELGRAQRLLALATLYEADRQTDDAIAWLRKASDAIESLHAARPQSKAVALALSDCYDRLSRLTAVEDRASSLEWLEKSRALHEEIAQKSPRDPWLQATWLDSELRSKVAAGFEAAEKELANIQRIDAGLSNLWPESPAAIYRLACQLAGRPAFLEIEDLSTDPQQVKESSD